MNPKITRILSYIHALGTLVLAAFFLNAGIKKFSPKPLRPIDKDILTEQIVVAESYAPPLGYNLTMNTMRQSGFLKMIGVFQLLAAALMILPKTRLSGLLLLLPIIFNIFFIHVFMDNRMHENVETGILLGANVVLILWYARRIARGLWGKQEKSA
ncbi:MAG: hypothetical protein IBJ09_11560 [Bacteroidia bacterium]|nr:hypothetical protein [Bacteroidia bacterium]